MILHYPRKIAILGAGRTGTSLGKVFADEGAEVYLWDRTLEKLKRMALPEPITIMEDLSEVAFCEDVLMTIRDDAMECFALELSKHTLHPHGLVCHTSGSLGLEVLNPLKGKVLLGKLHPFYTFPRRSMPIPARIFFGIQYEEERARERLEALITLLRGIPLPLQAHQSVPYHLSGVMVCNFLMVLVSLAETLWQENQLHETPKEGLLPLLEATVHNYQHYGVKDGITGPAARGDEKTLQCHRDYLQKHHPQWLPLYEFFTAYIKEHGKKSS